jgi:glycosyltransferase involved in cell wall biosynthesis
VHFAGPAVQTARYASLLTGIPFTVCVHHYDLFFRPPANYPALTRDAALVFTISKYNRQYLVNNYDIPADTIRVVHCGIDPEKFCPGKLNARQAGQPFSLISVGRLVDNKGHRYLIDACAILAQKGLQFTLKIIGDGKLRGCLEDRILTLGLAEHVKLLGGQSTEAVRSALHQADMFVLASLSEGVPVALMEAMATELPVIATRVRGVPELVEHDNTGLLVEAEDAVGLAEAIQRLAGDEMLRTRLGHAGRVKVSEEFNAETEYMEILKLWRQEVIR